MSTSLNRVLRSTGFIDDTIGSVPSLHLRKDETDPRFQSVFTDMRIGLEADALLGDRNSITSIVKDSGEAEPSSEDIKGWHEAAWNVGIAPLLWIVSPTYVSIYNCFAREATSNSNDTEPMAKYNLASPEDLADLNQACGRFATDTGLFWKSDLGKALDRRHRVDAQLLEELSALEARLIQIPLGVGSEVNLIKSRDLSQRLIGRAIFLSYLFERRLVDNFLPDSLTTDVTDVFSTRDKAILAFRWLRDTFNGDLFPMEDVGEEQSLISDSHLNLIRRFFAGESLVPSRLGQLRLFRFRFSAIPVELISSIYEQFAKSSAAGNAKIQGLHYTPIELVRFTLEPVLEGLNGYSKVVDPACGSGAFLVEAFRRLVWKRSQSQEIDRDVVRSILYNQLYGIDINRSALSIAAFSLYLASLEMDPSPITRIEDLRFQHLIGQTLHESDSVNQELPRIIDDTTFDAVVGNPPWTHSAVSKSRGSKRSGPRRSPDWDFLRLASKMAGPGGRIGFILKASPFFSRDKNTIAIRNSLFIDFDPISLVNLSELRKSNLFPGASAPAIVLFARCNLGAPKGSVLLGSVKWTDEFSRNGLFALTPSEFNRVSLEKIVHRPYIFKPLVLGTQRDSWLIDRLNREFPTLKTFLPSVGAIAGQGYQVASQDHRPPNWFYSRKVVDPKKYTPFRIDVSGMDEFDEPGLLFRRSEIIYRSPLILCPKSIKKLGSLFRGRYTVTTCVDEVVYSESFTGISFADGSERNRRLLSGILNSSITTFQLVFGSSRIGVERNVVNPEDVLALRMPDLATADPEIVQSVIDAEEAAATSPSELTLAALDEAVGRLYELDDFELTLTNDSLRRAEFLISDSKTVRNIHLMKPKASQLDRYANLVSSVVGTYLSRKAGRRLIATIYDRRLGREQPDSLSNYQIVRFHITDDDLGDQPVILKDKEGVPEDLLEVLASIGSTEAVPYLTVRESLRVYLGQYLYLTKPAEARSWAPTSALNDADLILADHWKEQP